MTKKILLYSDFKPGVSYAIDDCLLEQLNGTSCRIGYIPSDSDLKRRYFAKIEDQYSKLGISDLLYFDLGEEYDAAAIPKLLQCDAIHLSGGDPFQFLSLVRKRSFAGQLKAFVQKGGLLIGVSAGAMILSKSLGLADPAWMEKLTKPSKEKDKDKESALKLFDFEFYPHFKGDERTVKAIATYEIRNRTKVYACDDDAGIFICDDEIHLLGRF